MDGIKHNPINQPCDLINASGNLSLTKLLSLADKDDSAAVDIIKSISLDNNLSRAIDDVINGVVKNTVSKSVQNMISEQLLTTVNTMKSTTTVKAWLIVDGDTSTPDAKSTIIIASIDVEEPQAKFSPPHSEDTIKLDNVNGNCAHNELNVVNHVDDTNCLVTNPLIPKESTWNDYVTLAKFKIHHEKMTRSQQRNHFDVPILEYEKLAQIVGTDDYLSVCTGRFINIQLHAEKPAYRVTSRTLY